MFAGPLPPDTEAPDVVRAFATGASVIPVWQNELGGRTFAVGAGEPAFYVKWSPPGGPVLASEAVRLDWAAPFASVPPVVGHGTDTTGGSWLVTVAVPGRSAVSPRWLADPLRAVTAIGAGLRALHDALPVPDCPFAWSTDDRVADAFTRRNILHPARWHTDHQQLTVESALSRLAEPPPVDRLVVCHADACAPNTIIGDDGKCSGHVELGRLGVADRWADLAVATWSTQWNYGPGFEYALLDAYEIDPDPERISYYRLLWDLGP